MGKSNTSNNGKHWTSSDIKILKEMVNDDKPAKDIAEKLKRTESAIYNKAQDIDVSLQ